MMFARAHWMGLGLALACVLFCVAAPAFAAEEDADAPFYDVTMLELGKPWIQWLFGAAFVVLCLGIAFKNPHRSHLD